MTDVFNKFVMVVDKFEIINKADSVFRIIMLFCEVDILLPQVSWLALLIAGSGFICKTIAAVLNLIFGCGHL